MDSFELNKIVGAILGTLLFVMGAGFLADAIYAPTNGPGPGYDLPSAEAQTAEAGTTAAPKVETIAVRLAKADVKKGESVSKKCQNCHNFAEGAGAKVGPDLYGVVGRAIASKAGFAYSDALKKHDANGKTDWSYQALDEWLTSPKTFAPGTKMAFAGIEDAQQRADLIAYLHTLAASPVPFPAPEAKPAAESTTAAPASTQASSASQSSTPAQAGNGGGNDLATLMQNASADKGAKDTNVCKACHSFDKGGPNKVGPNLYGVVGRPIASEAGYSYSDGLKKQDPDGNTAWTFDKLDQWLTKPKDFAPGTKMAFAGIKDAKKRADVLAYLRSLSDSPAPLPGAATTPAPASSDNSAAAATSDNSAAAATSAPATSDNTMAPAAGSSNAMASSDTTASSTSGSSTASASDATASAASAPADNGLGALLASASADAGAKHVNVCKACHSFDKGGPNKVGPNLYGVVGRAIASEAGYSYSDGLKQRNADGSTTWTYQLLDEWLTKPRDFAKGTKMAFAGIKDAKKRADILAYLQSLSDNPVPFPGQ